MPECPICHKKVDVFMKANTDEPFTSYSPEEGLTVWGPYSVKKEVICQRGSFVHFKFSDIEERLVKMVGGGE